MMQITIKIEVYQMADREPARLKGYDKFPDEQLNEKAGASHLPQAEADTKGGQSVVKEASDSRTVRQVFGLGLRLFWPVVTKFFPWLSWLSLIVYIIIDLLLK